MVRCLTNYSSGKMGYALAEASRDRGAEVVLVTAPTSLPEPSGMDVIPVVTAQDMFEAVTKAATRADALIMAAAVAELMALNAWYSVISTISLPDRIFKPVTPW